MNTQSAIYGLKCVSRSVTCQEARKDLHRFLVGTTSAKETNELHIIEFDEDHNEVHSVAVYDHPTEVWKIAAHPYKADLVQIIHSAVQGKQKQQATLYRLSKEGEDNTTTQQNTEQHTQSLPLIPLSSLPLPASVVDIKAVVFNPLSDERSLVSLDDQGMKVWELEDAGFTFTRAAGSESASFSQLSQLSAVCWDPHHSQLLVVADRNNLTGFDLRSRSVSHSIVNAHSADVLDVDYNPNKPYHIVSCGLDRLIHLWDIRRPSSPLKILSAHTHWVWQCKFNRFHDQLILSAGSELVNLWSIISTSSAPVGEIEETAGEKGADKLIKTYSDHEDSVYSCCWSAFDAWVFATCSYDGRVVVNTVPPAEKYKILL